MSLDELLTERLRAVLREVLDERLGPLEERLVAPPDAAPDDDRALTVQEAAAFASYAVDTIMERVRAGDLPAHKPKGSREWRVRLGDLKSWLWKPAGAEVVDIDAVASRILARGGKVR